MTDFHGKIALITGGTSGIGQACAKLLAGQGATVLVVGRSEATCAATVDGLHSSGAESRYYLCDMRSTEQVRSLFQQIRTDFGHLDVAVNSAGIEGRSFTPMVDYPEDVWDEVLQVNLKAVWLCMQGEVELMLDRGGAIVNIASLAGLRASMSGGAAYTASKHGVVGLTRCAAKEYAARRIRVNALCPALIKTPMSQQVLGEAIDAIGAAHHPIGRIGLPEDVAAAVLWLCSEQGSFITGTALPIDGGYLL